MAVSADLSPMTGHAPFYPLGGELRMPGCSLWLMSILRKARVSYLFIWWLINGFNGSIHPARLHYRLSMALAEIAMRVIPIQGPPERSHGCADAAEFGNNLAFKCQLWEWTNKESAIRKSKPILVQLLMYGFCWRRGIGHNHCWLTCSKCELCAIHMFTYT